MTFEVGAIRSPFPPRVSTPSSHLPPSDLSAFPIVSSFHRPAHSQKAMCTSLQSILVAFLLGCVLFPARTDSSSPHAQATDLDAQSSPLSISPSNGGPRSSLVRRQGTDGYVECITRYNTEPTRIANYISCSNEFKKRFQCPRKTCGFAPNVPPRFKKCHPYRSNFGDNNWVAWDPKYTTDIIAVAYWADPRKGEIAALGGPDGVAVGNGWRCDWDPRIGNGDNSRRAACQECRAY